MNIQPKFARALAKNIRIMAESIASVSVIDASPDRGAGSVMESRARLCAGIDKAESNIAELLQQPMEGDSSVNQ